MRNFVLTSTSVTDGHPDKLCDRISDAIVDAYLARDPESRVNAECAMASGIVFLATRVSSTVHVDLPAIVRSIIEQLPIKISQAETASLAQRYTRNVAAYEHFLRAQVAVQEYGVSNPELVEGLRTRGAMVTSVPVYRWALPEDVAPLEHAVEELSAGRIDVTLVTTATQVVHLLQIAARVGHEAAALAGLKRSVIASIGPTTSEELRRHGLERDMEPSHPKIGYLVREAAERALALLVSKG